MRSLTCRGRWIYRDSRHSSSPQRSSACCGVGVGPTYLHKRGHSRLFVGDGLRAPKGSGFWVRYWVGLRGIGPARAGKLVERVPISAPHPHRHCARREARGRISFRAVREGRVDRFQCLLRPGPAVAWRCGLCAGMLGEDEAHNRSVLKERRIHPGALTCFAVAECLGRPLGISVSTGAPRDRSCARREARRRVSFRAAREGRV